MMPIFPSSNPPPPQRAAAERAAAAHCILNAYLLFAAAKNILSAPKKGKGYETQDKLKLLYVMQPDRAAYGACYNHSAV